MRLLRYSEDIDAVLDRLRQNPFLGGRNAQAGRFSTTCEDSDAGSFIATLSSFVPFADSIKEPISVLARSDSERSNASWLGSQQGNVISL